MPDVPSPFAPPCTVARDRRDALVRAVAGLGNRQATLETVGIPPHRRIERHLAGEPLRRLAIKRTLDVISWDAPAAVRHLRWAPVARARLEAALVGVPDGLLDSHPFAGEWSLRQQLAHVELTDRRYAIATAYAARRAAHEPVIPPPHLYPARVSDPGGHPGEPLPTILASLRAVRGAAIAPLLDLDADQLLRPTEWHTAEHTVGFRLHRFAAHDLEMTTDIARTLAALGHIATEGGRLASALLEAWGEVEALFLDVPPESYMAEPAGDVPSLATLLRSVRLADQDLLAHLAASDPTPGNRHESP